MYALLLLTMILMFAVIYKLVFNQYMNIAVLLSLFWAVSSTIAIYFNMNYLKVEQYIWNWVVLIILTINLSYLLLHKPVTDRPIIIPNPYYLNKTINIIIIVSFLSLLSPFIKALEIIITNGFNLKIVRDFNYLFISDNYNTLQILIVKTIPLTLLKLLLLFSVTKTLTTRKQYFFTLIILLMSIISYGGRKDILLLFVFYFINYLYSKKDFVLKKRYGLYVLVILFVLTNFRGNSNVSFIKSVYDYFSAPYSYLQFLINTETITYDKTFGYLTFSFLLEPIMLCIKLINRKIKTPTHYLNVIVQPFANIGSNFTKYYNNNSTSIFVWLKDFGKVGIVLGPLLMMILIVILERSYMKNNNIFRYNFLVFVASYSLFSFAEYPFNGMGFFIVFFILYFLERSVIND